MQNNGISLRTIFFLIFLLLANTSIANSVSTAESSAMDALSRYIETYYFVNKYKLPTSWEQLKQVDDLAEGIDQTNRNLKSYQAYPLEDHYQFIAQPMELQKNSLVYEGTKILLLRSIPLTNPDYVNNPDILQQWRYAIYQDNAGRIRTTRVPEADVQAMLKKNSTSLEVKVGLPAVETEQRQGPDTTHTRQPNPADAEFLALHPEYNPLKNPNATRPPQSLIDEYKRTHPDWNKPKLPLANRPGQSNAPNLAASGKTMAPAQPSALTIAPSASTTDAPASTPVWPWIIGGMALVGIASVGYYRFRK